jgi:hypothetical protein
MTDILNKTVVLVLNRNWQAINVRKPQKGFCQMATNVATALGIEFDDEAGEAPGHSPLGTPSPRRGATRGSPAAVRRILLPDSSPAARPGARNIFRLNARSGEAQIPTPHPGLWPPSPAPAGEGKRPRRRGSGCAARRPASGLTAV